MAQTDRQKANDLLEEFASLGIKAEDVLNHVIGNSLSGTNALEALESFKKENLPGYEGIPTQDEDGGLIPMDKNGDEIYVGAPVNVDPPGLDDFWNFDFGGTIIEIEDDFAIVEDGDGDCFSVEFGKLELS
jgi:hypothetical protein